jgi:hypothetical protein
MGVGKYNSTRNKDAMNVWVGMLRRCYHSKVIENNPSYIFCTVDPVWHNFQNFAEWFEDNYVKGWELDKDLFSEDAKIYSSAACCFLPQKINLIVSEITKDTDGIYSDKRNQSKTYTAKYNGKVLGTFNSRQPAQEKYFEYKFSVISSEIQKFQSLLDAKVYLQLTKLVDKRREQVRQIIRGG